MAKTCDHKSVGMIVRNSQGEILIIFRKNFPQMYACPAGHVDDFGSPLNAAKGELQEEVGVSGVELKSVLEKEFQNPCKREGGTHHHWHVFETEYNGEAKADSDAKSASWKSAEDIKLLIQRTKDYRSGKISDEDWAQDPGLEDVWIDIFKELEYFK